MLGGQKKFMGCGLLGGGNQGDTTNSSFEWKISIFYSQRKLCFPDVSRGCMNGTLVWTGLNIESGYHCTLYHFNTLLSCKTYQMLVKLESVRITFRERILQRSFLKDTPMQTEKRLINDRLHNWSELWTFYTLTIFV